MSPAVVAELQKRTDALERNPERSRQFDELRARLDAIDQTLRVILKALLQDKRSEKR